MKIAVALANELDQKAVLDLRVDRVIQSQYRPGFYELKNFRIYTHWIIDKIDTKINVDEANNIVFCLWEC